MSGPITTVSKEEKLKQLILGGLPKDSNYKWVRDEFAEILRDKDIRKQLDDAYTETSVINWVNRHGVLHGITVTYNSLRLFKLIYDGTIESSYEKYFNLKKPLILFGLLVSSYIHDAGRAYNPHIEQIKTHGESLEDVIGMLQSLKGVRILREFADKDKLNFFRMVRELCLCHDMKEIESERAEIAIIKLADTLDCDKERVYSEDDKDEFKEKDDLDKMHLVLLNDKHPEMYYGSKEGIGSISMEWNDYESVYEIKVTIKDYSAVTPIKNLLTTLKACEQSKAEPVKNLADRVRVIANKDNNTVVLYPKNPQAIGSHHNIKVVQRTIEFDIFNGGGDGSITDYVTIKNERETAGIKGISISRWGYTSMNAEELKIVAHQLINDKLEEQLDVKPTFVLNDGKEHWWTIVLNRALNIGDDPIKIQNVCTGWKGFVNIEADEGAYFVGVPHESLELKVLLPREIKKERIHPSFEIRSGKGPKPQTIYTEKLETSYDYNPSGNKYLITKNIEKPANGYLYSIKWNLMN
jgi:metal-dependent HD superfamily phosphatase/phosphodiesterase